MTGAASRGAALELVRAAVGTLGDTGGSAGPASFVGVTVSRATVARSGAISPTLAAVWTACSTKPTLRATPTTPTTSARTPAIKLATIRIRRRFDQRRA